MTDRESVIRILRYVDVSPKELTKPRGSHTDVSETVQGILDAVRREGDAALFRFTERFDRVKLDSLAVSDEEWESGLKQADPAFLRILEDANERITRYHEQQRRQNYAITGKDGVILGKVFRPIEKVGMYVPNGTAPYPSTVLMDIVPARIAGCEEIIMVSPPGRDGRLPPSILAAARVAGITRIFKVGGAQAIGALAYGTESIPKVYKIIGPGNAYEKQVHGLVSTDTVAGPSEVLIVAEGDNDPRVLAADMLAQAEHDPDASAMLVTGSTALAEAVAAELKEQLAVLPRREIAEQSIRNNGLIILTDGRMETALEIANLVAPEHLELCVDEPPCPQCRFHFPRPLEPGTAGRLYGRTEPYPAHRRLGALLVAALGGRLHDRLPVYLLYPGSAAGHRPLHRALCRGGKPAGTCAQHSFPLP